MCILIRSAEVGIELVFWRSADLTIYVRSDAPAGPALDEIRAILIDLGAPPSAGQSTLTCFCGDPIPLPPGLTTAQTTPSHRELRYGA